MAFRDYSLMEGGHQNNFATQSGLIFGRITRVYPEERMYEVKTFGSAGPLCDHHIVKCQVLSADCNPEGDGSVVIPRENAFCIVAYVDGQPYIVGFVNPLNTDGTATSPDSVQEDINAGDKSIKTIFGNKVNLRASGEIEIFLHDLCYTTYYPTSSLIRSLCRNYEFDTDGGSDYWNQFDSGNNTYETVRRVEVRDDKLRTNIIQTYQGTINKGDPLIYSREIGHGVDETEIADVVHTTEIKNTGETDIFIRDAGNDNGHKLNIKPSGETTLDIGGKSITHILPTGETNLAVNGKATVNIKPDGTTTIDVGPGKSTIVLSPSGEIKITSAADVNVNATGKVKVKAAKIELNGAASGVTTMNGHQGVIDMISGAPIQPSKTVFSDV